MCKIRSRVVIINGARQLKAYLRHQTVSAADESRYICFGELSSKLFSLLEEKRFRRSDDLDMNQAQRERFIKQYIEIIGAVGKDLNSKIWWASDIASKNRFTSKLSQFCQQFLEIIEVVNKDNYQQLLVINPPWVILSSLKKALRKADLEIECRSFFLKKWTEVILRYVRKLAGVFYHIVTVYGRVIYARKLLSEKIKVVSQNKDLYVLKTFIYDHSFKDGVYRDSFFERLPVFLKGRKNLLIYACILGDYKKAIRNIANCKEYTIIPLELHLCLPDVLEAVKEWTVSKLRLRNDAYLFGHAIKDLVNNELLRTANGVQFYQFLHYWSTRNLLKTASVETFLMTHENNPWEKMCTLSIREVSPKTKVIWYQNTVMPQAALNMFRAKGEADNSPAPDLILTLGESTKRIMQKYGSYENLRVEPSCGLKFEYLFNNSIGERRKQGNILILLEGIFDSYRVVNYVLRMLKDNSYYQLKLRTHPMLPLETFKHKLNYNLDKIANITISKGTSLSEDIDWADIVIYWGSMAALEALSMGRPLIHFNMGSFLSSDPLFECDDLKWAVSEKDSLLAKIEQISSLDDDDFFLKRNRAKVYIEKYFFPVDEESLSKFVN